ncbi:MAG: Gfo/Idh/MocA family oxidoreductase [Kofleriaceae bacterium]
MLRVGLLGTGDAGRHHARALAGAQRQGRLAWTCVAGRDPANIDRVALAIPAPTSLIDVETLFTGSACDAVIIATPDGLHAEHATRALAAGMHVLVEKPLALELADAEALVAAARDRVLAVGYQLRHHAGHQLVREQLPALVGELRAIHVRWAWPDPAVAGWRAQGTAARWWSLAALGTHGLDLALWLAGDDITHAACVREPASGIDRAAEVSLRFANGVLAQVSVAITHRALPSFTIAGTLGEVIASDTLGARGAGTIVHRDTATRTSRELVFPVEDPYLRQLGAFAARCGGTGPRVDPHAVSNVALLHRITSA